jgi:DNA-binding transcriptional ArsR family regulator
MTYQDALEALADPTRRRVLELLRERPASVGELAEHLPVSRPAVSQHLKVLKQAGLVVDHHLGNRRIYEVVPEGLADLAAYLGTLWSGALERFRAEVERAGGDAR